MHMQSQVIDISVYVNCQNVPVVGYTSMYMYELLKTIIAGSTSPGNFSRSVFPTDLEPRTGYSPKTMRKVHACSCSWKLLGFSKLLLSWVWPWVMLQGGTQQSFIWGGSTGGPTPYPFIYLFYRRGLFPFCILSIDKWYPLHVCSPF